MAPHMSAQAQTTRRGWNLSSSTPRARAARTLARGNARTHGAVGQRRLRALASRQTRRHSDTTSLVAARSSTTSIAQTSSESSDDSGESRSSTEAEAHTHWRNVAILVAGVMLTVNMHRSAFSSVAMVLQKDYAITTSQMGLLHSAQLWGYGAGQIPSGILADKIGGPLILFAGAFMWSVCTAFFPHVASWTNPFISMVILRILFGFFSAVALPATTATTSQVVPLARRATTISLIYASFNMGTVVGMAATPALTVTGGWSKSFELYGSIGMVWSAAALIFLFVTKAGMQKRLPKENAKANRGSRIQNTWKQLTSMSRGSILQILGLLWSHSVIGFGYFVLLSWVPTFLSSQVGMSSPRMLGLLSAVPFLTTAVLACFVGNIADYLIVKRKWAVSATRRLMMVFSTLGPALGLAMLAMTPTQATFAPLYALIALTVSMGFQAFNYPGFHAYVQDVAGPSGNAGLLLSVTNTGGVIFGAVGNLLTGVMVEKTGTFASVFWSSSALYVLSFFVWCTIMTGEELK